MGKTPAGGLNIRVQSARYRQEKQRAWEDANPGKPYPGPEEQPRGQSGYDQPDPRSPKLDREDLPFYRVWRPHGALSAADWAAVDAEEERDRKAWEAAHPGEKYTPASYPRRYPRFEES